MTFTYDCHLRRIILRIVLVLVGCAFMVMCDEIEYNDGAEEEPWYYYAERRLQQAPSPIQIYPPSQIIPISPTILAPVAPTDSSSAAPSPAFVEQQVSVVVSPSPSLAPSVTAEPSSTPVPTRAPTEAPTRRPTRAPTKAPTTPVPTKAPTKAPTTPRPTQVPTKAPTPNPTKTPTGAPTKAPTRRPTAAPTKQPTQQPTIQPTVSPTEKPSPAPTPSPSAAPSSVPSWAPTHLPTVTPTQSSQPTTATPAPTVSEAPSPQPSLPPSSGPTAVASSTPSAIPSAGPSSMPSVPPTGMPTLTLQEDIVKVDMLLIQTPGVLRERAIFDFQSATEGHITQTIETMEDDGVVELEYLFVNANILTQKVVEKSATLAPRSLNRLLQNNNDSTTTTIPLRPLEISLSVLVEYRADDTYSPTDWVSSAFNSEEKRDSFINRLKQIGDSSFDYVEDVKLLVDGTIPVEMDPEETPDSSETSLGIVVGAVAGGAVVAALAILFFMRRSPRNHAGGGGGDGKMLASTEGNTSGVVSNPMTTEILVERQDDISTLGDPVFGGGAMMNLGAAEAVDRDERTASVGDDYDYAKDYLMQQRGSMDDTIGRERLASADTGTSGTPFTRVGSGPMGASVFDDDASFEQQYDQEQGYAGEEKFDITVPPGKLGMVIDTPNGSVPIIHAIKADSVLAGKVRVGDRLLSVDSEDVTNLTAVQVSKLISLKSKEERVLVFARGGSGPGEAKGQ